MESWVVKQTQQMQQLNTIHTFLIIVAHVVIYHHAEVQQKIPRVFGYRPLVVILHIQITTKLHYIIAFYHLQQPETALVNIIVSGMVY